MRTRQRRKRLEPVKKNCCFCKSKTLPYWRDVELLSKHLSPRARILPRSITGICAKHQRVLSDAIKQARHLALLPFITQVTR